MEIGVTITLASAREKQKKGDLSVVVIVAIV